MLVVTNNLSENISESPVRDLGLTISLGMVRRGEAELGAVNLVKPSPESVGKARVTLGVEAMSAQAVKDVAKVPEVLLKGTTVDQDIVEVEENVLLQDVPEDVVHRPLEGTSWMECSTSRIDGMPSYENDDGKTLWYSRMRSRTVGSRSTVYRASSSASARDGGVDSTDGGGWEREMGVMEIEGGSGSRGMSSTSRQGGS
ncbi:hypothetical protein CBR_g31717 [Chara braunii]|uniref:Uncharacterized protein n=1 Tax=Chara braunii TaxID=69332 RepID=A0A388JY22_CHABU|nr:hypothetical protein CBR_g31717 [Chara braunii]|eukprot:GBG62700.1 hypothetical protein CBR_g31717 [Chara braunii]